MDRRLQELIALRAQLRRLPAFTPPADAWQRIGRALDAPGAESVQRIPAAAEATVAGPMGTPPARNVSRWRLAAVAAGLLPVCALALFWLQRERAGGVATAVVGPAASTDGVATLVDRSQQLEAVLQQLPRRPAVERAVTSAAIDALQSRIQLLDLALSSGDGAVSDDTQARQLWGERVQLLNSLVGMRYAEAVRVDVQAATQEGAL